MDDPMTPANAGALLMPAFGAIAIALGIMVLLALCLVWMVRR
jgi:hypothetical protein